MDRWGSGRTAVPDPPCPDRLRGHSVTHTQAPARVHMGRDLAGLPPGTGRSPGPEPSPARPLLTAAEQMTTTVWLCGEHGGAGLPCGFPSLAQSTHYLRPCKAQPAEQRGQRATQGRGAPNSPMSQHRRAAGALGSSPETACSSRDNESTVDGPGP